MAHRIYSSGGIKSDWTVEDPRLSLTVLFPKWKKWTRAFQATRTTDHRRDMITQNQTTREQALQVISERIARLNRHLLELQEGEKKGYKESETETRIDECRMLWDRIETETFTHYDPDAEKTRKHFDPLAGEHDPR